MWGQLGVGTGRQENDSDDEPQQTPGGGLWSKFVQVAADVAQDLAQPGDDEEEYEEGGWGDESLGLDGNPSWEEQEQQQAGGDEQYAYEGGEEHYEEGHQPYHEGGEEHYYDDGAQEQYFEGGEEQYTGEEHYEGEEGYQYDQNAEGEENGWGEEEEVDFGEDEQQPIDENPQQLHADHTLFDGTLEQLDINQPVAEEEPPADPNEWDLEDENLFDDDETNNNEEKPDPETRNQAESEHDGYLGDVVEPSSGDNGWGQDDDINFDDSLDVGGAGESPAETTTDAEQELELNEAVNEIVDNGQSEIAGQESLPQNTESSALQAFQGIHDAGLPGEGGGWNDDFDFDASQNLDDVQMNNTATVDEATPAQGDTKSTPNGILEEGGGDGWDDDLGIDGSQNVDDEKSIQDPVAIGDQAPAVQPESTPLVDGEINVHETFDTAEQSEGDGWDEDLGLDESQNVGDEQHPQNPVGSDDQVPTAPLENIPVVGDVINAKETFETPEQGGGDGWDDDLGLDESQNIDGNQDEAAEVSSTGQEDVSHQREVEDAAKGEGQGWDEEDLNVSSHNVGIESHVESETPAETVVDTKVAASEANDESHSQSEAPESQPQTSTGVESATESNIAVESDPLMPQGDAEQDAWNDSGLEFDDDELNLSGDHQTGLQEEGVLYVSAVPEPKHRVKSNDEGDDDSTVERTNIGVEQSQSSDDPEADKQHAGDETNASELNFTLPGRTPSRRATIRASNTSSACISRKDSEDDGSDSFKEKILGTSVMFADLKTSDQEEDQKNSENVDDDTQKEEGDTSVGEKGGTSEASVIRDNVSSVSEISTEVPKPIFETQISMMTLKSIADSCPSRQHGTDSDEDEDGFGPVVDKIPEVSKERNATPELSTMTINSTAVAAHSVNEDIQRDEDMEGTYYGESTAGEGQSNNENAWEEDDASSLGGLHDLGEKIVNFELGESPMDGSAPQTDSITAPLKDSIQEEAAALTPPLNSSMAILYADDDNSVPSRDKDDDNEDDYKPVVDIVPKPVQKLATEKSGRTLNSMAVMADIAGGAKTDGSTAIKEGGEEEENAWDGDGASLDDIDESGDGTKEKSRIVVDNTPAEACSTGGKSGGSLAAVESAENSCPSRVHDSDEEVYGLVVDQIPDSPPPLMDQMSVAASSMAVVANNVEEDLKQDEELDASEQGGSTGDDLGASSWDNDGSETEGKSKEEKDVSADEAPAGTGEGTIPTIDVEVSPDGDRVVDLTPKMESRKVSRLSSNSLAVLAHSVNHDFGDNDDEDEENIANFGPIVDITPPPQKTPTMTPNSTAVQASNMRDDIKQDETTEGGVGDVNWDDECPELEDMELGDDDEEEDDTHTDSSDAFEESIPSALRAETNQEQVVLVDHTPEGEAPRKLMGDASLAVLAPSEDGTCASINADDDVDDIDPGLERVSYGPVVDHTPTLRNQPLSAPSTALSVTFSLAVEARSVDEDFKLDDEMDETFCGDTTIGEVGGENGWDDQTLEDIDTDQSRRGLSAYKLHSIDDNEEGQVMVDHTPQLNSPTPRMGDASLVALAPSVASTYHSADDDIANDDDSITHEEDLYGKVVDHTPRLAPIPLVTSQSMAVGASSADYRSEMERDEDMEGTCYGESADDNDDTEGWGADEEALEGIETSGEALDNKITEENVVDHTPETEEEEKPSHADPSVAVLAPSDDGSGEEDDNDTYDGNHVYGPVVDMTPELPSNTVMSSSVAANHEGDLDATLFGDSTVGPETGWDEDDTALDDLVEDEKEAGLPDAEPSNSNLWQSTELISDNASSHMGGSTIGRPDATSAQDGVVLVDHTPSEIDSSAQKNSVAWLVNVESGISGDETEDAGASWRENDAGTEANAQPEGDQVVDRIPQRPESRFGDASTLVVADPSEVLSHVGDMLQEEGDFGPVVDLTPPSHPGLQHAVSAAGSTIVVAPTIGPDDLDDADPDDTVNAAEDNGWDQDPPELELAPNPQSGNEEENARVREQVVDFLPPQAEPGPDLNRVMGDGWSEVATGGAPSVFQADPKEDEFGLISTASQVASSECDALAGEDETEDFSKQETNENPNVVVDPLPRPFEVGVQNLDSTASLAQSLASEDEDDESPFYQVVDHLPSIRSSLPPSRGGSTVDALATVSEVIDDDDDDEGDDADTSSAGGGNDGWDDDDLGEIDLSEHPQPEPSQAQSRNPVAAQPKSCPEDQNNGQVERGMTVRFRSVVDAIFVSNGDSDVPEGKEKQRAPPSTDASEIFHEAEETDEPNAWDDDLEDFDESLNMNSNRDSGIDTSILSSPEKFAQFAEADTPPATPYSSRPRHEHAETNGAPAVGVALPDLSLGQAASTQQCSICENASTVDCPCVQRILKKKEDGDDTVNIDYNKLLQTEISKRLLIEEEAKDIRSQLETLKTSKSAGEVRMETVRTLQEHVKVVEVKLQETRNTCDELRNKNEELKNSIDQSATTLMEWTELQKQWTSRESTLQEEINRAKRDLDVSLAEAKQASERKDQDIKAEKDGRQEIVGSLQHQLETMQTECSSLRADNSSLAENVQALRKSLDEKQAAIEDQAAKDSTRDVELKNLQASLAMLETGAASAQEVSRQLQELQIDSSAKDSAYAKLQGDMASLQERALSAEADCRDRAKISAQIEEEMAEKQRELTSVQSQLENLKALHAQETQQSSRLQDLEAEIQRLSVEREEREGSARELHASNEAAMNDATAMLSEKDYELEAAFEQLGRLEEELHAFKEENDSLVGALNEANENASRLQQRIEDQGVEESVMERNKNTEIEALVQERAELRNNMAARTRQLQAQENHLLALKQEKEALESKITQVTASCEHFKTAAESSTSEAAEVVESQSRELESLRQELTKLMEERDDAHMERELLVERSTEMESSVAASLEKISELEACLSEVRQEVAKLREQNSFLTNERDQYVAKCEGLEKMLGDNSQASEEISRLVSENNSLANQVSYLQQELENQGFVLQNFEARTAALENELLAEMNSGTAKDEDLAELRRELESSRANLEESAESANRLHQAIAELQDVVKTYDSERQEFEQGFAMHASREQEFQEIAESLTNDRAQAIEARDNIARENEEMLVQFGLLHEDMEEMQGRVEASDAQIRGLQQRLASAENAQFENNPTEEDAKEVQDLRNEQCRLTQEINELTSSNSEKETVIRSISSELEHVRAQVIILEQANADAAAVATENETLRFQVEGLEVERNELDANCTSQATELSCLKNELSQAQKYVAELESQTANLEEACSSRDQALQQKDAEIREMVTRLHEASGSSSEDTKEILDLRDRLNRIEASRHEANDQLHALTSNHEKAQEELSSRSQQVRALEASLQEMELQLASKEEEARQESDKHESEVTTLENKLQKKAKEVAELTKEGRALSAEVNSLQGSLEATHGQLDARSELTTSADAELQSLKRQMSAMQDELESVRERSNSHEESLQTEIQDLKRTLASKDGEVVMLKHKVQSLSVQLGESITQVQAKEDEMLKLASEMDNLRQEQENLHKGAGTSAALVLQQTKENADDVQNLRSTVVSLASALEASEGRRADAIDRLLRERETYADSLRHMSDSVKRFYNTLSGSEP